MHRHQQIQLKILHKIIILILIIQFNQKKIINHQIIAIVILLKTYQVIEFYKYKFVLIVHWDAFNGKL
jgi:hypothetical protein